MYSGSPLTRNSELYTTERNGPGAQGGEEKAEHNKQVTPTVALVGGRVPPHIHCSMPDAESSADIAAAGPSLGAWSGCADSHADHPSDELERRSIPMCQSHELQDAAAQSNLPFATAALGLPPVESGEPPGESLAAPKGACMEVMDRAATQVQASMRGRAARKRISTPRPSCDHCSIRLTVDDSHDKGTGCTPVVRSVLLDARMALRVICSMASAGPGAPCGGGPGRRGEDGVHELKRMG